MSTQIKRRPSIIDAIKSLFASDYEEDAVLTKELLESQKKADKIVSEAVNSIVETKASKTGKSGKGYSKKQLDDFTDRLKNTANKSGQSTNIQKQKDNSKEDIIRD